MAFLFDARFLRFATIGGVNTLIHGLLLTLIMQKTTINVVFANFIAFYVANSFSYFMNCFFTFNTSVNFRSYIRFFSASILSLVLTLFISSLADFFGLHYLMGFIMVMTFVPIISFFFMKCWAFRKD